MKIEIAEHCGFCSGVKNAVDMANAALDTYGRVAVLGDLVHNKVVVDKLKARGLVYVDRLEDVGEMPLLLRAHGTDAELIRKAEALGLHILDGTCPLVNEIHRRAMELENEGRQIIVIGDKEHDEVLGIVSRLRDYCIVSALSDLKACTLKSRTGVVVQSTQRLDRVLKILPGILTTSRDCRIINTICEPTRRNQEEIHALAKHNDCVLVIGDPHSANSKRLFAVARSLNRNSHMVAGVGDIDPDWFRDCASLGITAGASTPGSLIESIKEYVKNLNGDKTK